MLGYTRAPVPGPGPHYDFPSGQAQSPLHIKRPSLGQAQGQGQRGIGSQPGQRQSIAPGTVKYGQTPLGDPPLQARPSAPDPSMHPQFSHFAAVNESPATPGSYQTGPDALGHGSDKKGKKRGRPSKADNEIRAAQALARGEPWPPVKKSKIPRTSAEAPAGPGDGAAPQFPTNKIAEKPKITPESEAISGQRQAPSSQKINATSGEEQRSPGDEPHSPEMMQIDSGKGRSRSTIPETQTSEFPAADSLLARMQAQAEQSAQAIESRDDTHDPTVEPAQADTVQSSVTLQQETTTQTEQPRSTISQA